MENNRSVLECLSQLKGANQTTDIIYYSLKLALDQLTGVGMVGTAGVTGYSGVTVSTGSSPTALQELASEVDKVITNNSRLEIFIKELSGVIGNKSNIKTDDRDIRLSNN